MRTTVTMEVTLYGRLVKLSQELNTEEIEQGTKALLRLSRDLEDKFVIPGPPVTMKTLIAEKAPEWAKSAMKVLEEE
tara:strand:+ start:2242 stop:2472 length:231 start_codon:yes stop_codon:yes gene_type:complete